MRRLTVVGLVAVAACGKSGGGGGDGDGLGGGIADGALTVEASNTGEAPVLIADGSEASEALLTVWKTTTYVTPFNYPTLENVAMYDGVFDMLYEGRRIVFVATENGVIKNISIKEDTKDWTVKCEPILTPSIGTCKFYFTPTKPGESIATVRTEVEDAGAHEFQIKGTAVDDFFFVHGMSPLVGPKGTTSVYTTAGGAWQITTPPALSVTESTAIKTAVAANARVAEFGTYFAGGKKILVTDPTPNLAIPGSVVGAAVIDTETGALSGFLPDSLSAQVGPIKDAVVDDSGVHAAVVGSDLTSLYYVNRNTNAVKVAHKYAQGSGGSGPGALVPLGITSEKLLFWAYDSGNYKNETRNGIFEYDLASGALKRYAPKSKDGTDLTFEGTPIGISHVLATKDLKHITFSTMAEVAPAETPAYSHRYVMDLAAGTYVNLTSKMYGILNQEFGTNETTTGIEHEAVSADGTKFLFLARSTFPASPKQSVVGVFIYDVATQTFQRTGRLPNGTDIGQKLHWARSWPQLDWNNEWLYFESDYDEGAGTESFVHGFHKSYFQPVP
jgi:hypothetical protein